MKKILVPIDFTTYSNNAFRMATYIARIKGMSIKLLHVVEEPAFALFADKRRGEYIDDMERETREHLTRLVSLENTNELKVEYEVRRSKAGVAREILKEECDLIIMGRQREDNNEAFVAGSVTEKVVRLSAVPVISVSRLPENYAIRKIAFAANFEEEEVVKPILKRVLDLSTIFNSQLYFVYVIPNREFLNDAQAVEKARGITDKYDLTGHQLDVYVAPTPEEGITDFINDADPDLVVLLTHGRTGVQHFFLGSTAENMASYSTVPILTYNTNPKKFERSAQPLSREKVVWSKGFREKS